MPDRDPLIRGRPGFPKKFFRPSGPLFSLKNKELGGGGAAGPPGLSPGSATGNYFNSHVFFVFTFLSVQLKYSAQHYLLSSFEVCMLLAFIPHPISSSPVICFILLLTQTFFDFPSRFEGVNCNHRDYGIA